MPPDWLLGNTEGSKPSSTGGADAAFRTELLRFPDAHFSVITLCNAGDADAGDLVRRVAHDLVAHGRLFVRYPRGESELKPTITDVFEAQSPFGTINYQCSAASRCDTFTVTNERVRRLRFNRVDLNPVGSQRGSK